MSASKAVVGTVLIGVAITSAVIIAIETLGGASWLSSPRSNQMCADAGILGVVKGLINEQTLNVGKFGAMIQQLDSARGGNTDALDGARANLVWTKRHYAATPMTHPQEAQDRAKEVRAIEDRIVNLEKRLAVQKEQEKRPPEPIAENECGATIRMRIPRQSG
jgi:hypothetical protein